MKKQNLFLKTLLISGIATLALANANNNATKNVDSFAKVEKEIRTIASYGLKPINNAEKDHIAKIVGLPKNNIKFYGKEKGPEKGLVEYILGMRGRPLVLYKNTEKNYYIAGYIFDKNGKNLTVNEVKNVFNNISKEQYKSFFKEIKEKAPQFVAEIKGEGPKDKVAIIYTDPQCPFCKRFEKNLNGLEYLRKNYGKVYVVEFPLYFHKEATQRAYWIINNLKNAKTPQEKIEILKQGSFKKYDEILKENKQNRVDYSKELKELREINTPMNFGTPTITDNKGNSIREKVMKDILVKKLHLKSSQITTN